MNKTMAGCGIRKEITRQRVGKAGLSQEVTSELELKGEVDAPMQ